MIPELVEVAGAPVLVWRCPEPWFAVSSAPLGGGFGERDWAINATVGTGYDRADPDAHLAEIAGSLGLSGAGVGLLTAVDVREVVHREEGGVLASVTTGIGGYPTWAAAPSPAAPEQPQPAECGSCLAQPGESHIQQPRSYQAGTVNAVCWLPVRLSAAAMVNAVATVAEAKAQAFWEAGVPGTGTATDATVLLCPTGGPAEPFGGPRSPIGSALARAVHAAVRAGLG